MEIFLHDSIILLEKGDDLKTAFLKSSEENLVFPFLPIFQADTNKFFKTALFIKEILSFPATHYIKGFRIMVEGKEIKYGGKIQITNTGLNITPIFFGIERRKILGEQILIYSINEVYEVYVKLIPRMYIAFAEISDESDLEKILSADIYPKFVFKEGEKIFSIMPTIQNEHIFELPKDTKDLLEILPYRKIQFPDRFYPHESASKLIKENSNLVLIIEDNYLLPLYAI